VRGGGIRIDDSEIRTLELKLAGAPARIQADGPRVINKGRKMVELGMRDAARDARRRARTHIPHLPNAVTSEMETRWSAVIGFIPGTGNQASLAHIIAYGSVNNAPTMDHTSALRKATPHIMRELGETAEEDVLGGGRE
jgi:hypothetical protein